MEPTAPALVTAATPAAYATAASGTTAVPRVWSLRLMLLLAFAGLTLGLTLILTFLVGRTESRVLREEIGHGMATTARQMEQQFSAALLERYRDVLQVSAHSLFHTSKPDRKEQRQALEALQASFPAYVWIGATDASGKVMAATGGLLEGADVSARDWFQRGLKGPAMVDVHEAKLLAKLVPGPADGSPLRLLDVAMPIHDEQWQLVGVVGAHFSWEWAQALRDRALEPARERAGLEMMVLNASGEVLLGPPETLGRSMREELNQIALSRGRDYAVVAGNDGREYLMAQAAGSTSAASPGLGWVILLRQDIGNAFETVADLQRQVAAVGALVFLLAMLLSALLSRHLAGPLHRLGQAADALREGSRRDMPLMDDYREAQRLSRALKSFGEEMEARVANRTVALEEANDALRAAMEKEAEVSLQLREREALLRRSQDELRTIADNLPVMVGHLDTGLRYTFMNETFRVWFDVDPDTNVGQPLGHMSGGLFDTTLYAHATEALKGRRVDFDLDVVLRGENRHLALSFIPHMEDGRLLGLFAMAHDVTDSKLREQVLSEQALSDTLTGLPNRRMLEAQLPMAMARAQRNGKPLAVLFLDLDGFKNVNDLYGHPAGDAVLRQFGERLTDSVRRSDMVVRLAGDEFVLLLENLQSGAIDACTIADKVIAAMEQPFDLGDGIHATLSTSIGISLHAPGEETSPVNLMHFADQAMYAAKQGGKNRRVLSGELGLGLGQIG
ncbi:diguanylate cyclase domain-containing protein [Uliginosibacterium sp. H1]|uniref:diguanylate cyclase domain-containing protein n=1 Tax=Uliginosibacterium sp. H1 TaxID=3114757 RepID=UPI002E1971BA|nr:diguanylate cyclase [Uliginosibacterium sp. H1]